MPYSCAPQAKLQALQVTDLDNPLRDSALVGASLAHGSGADALLTDGVWGEGAVKYKKGAKVLEGKRKLIEFGRSDKQPASPVGREQVVEDPFHVATWYKHLVSEFCAAATAAGCGTGMKAAFHSAHLRHNARRQMEAAGWQSMARESAPNTQGLR